MRIYGQPKVHERSGKFSVVVDRVEPVGEGALKRAYELLRKTLEQEGLFDPIRKRPLPKFPRRIGLVASRESAAYSDFLRILGNRWSDVEVNSVHVQVQGKDAIGDIISALSFFSAHPELADVLVLTRGGGSLEDLQAFNSEEVTRAVFSSKIPIVVGVGHERDETLADFAADVRASTPSNAAIESLRHRLVGRMEQTINDRLTGMDRSVRVMERGIMSSISSFRHRQRDLADAFSLFVDRVAGSVRDLSRLEAGLFTASDLFLTRLSGRLLNGSRLLESFNPKSVLRRGYAIARYQGQPIKDAAAVAIGGRLDVELHQGQVGARVEEIIKSKNQ